MLKTVYKFLELMKAQRRKLYLSFLFNFLDGIFIMIPLVIAYYMVGSIPELNKNATRQLDEKLFVFCIAAMAVTIIFSLRGTKPFSALTAPRCWPP